MTAKQNPELKPNDRVVLTGNHPWKSSAGTLINFCTYGVPSLGLEGWRVKLDNGVECYAITQQIRRAP